MKLSPVIAATTGLLLLQGCSTPGNAPAQTGSMAPAAAPACIQANTKVETCEARGSGAVVCPVYVFNTPSGTVVFPYNLKVPDGRKARIVWHLLEPKASFVTDDGPQELKSNDEFEDGGATDDADGGSVSANGRKYKFVYKNIKPSRTHSYTIQFRTQSGTVIRCDPKITNEAN